MIEKSKGPWKKGKKIGTTTSGKDVYEDPNHEAHSQFYEQDHEDARKIHMEEEVTGRTMTQKDEAAATHGRKADKIKLTKEKIKDSSKKEGLKRK